MIHPRSSTRQLQASFSLFQIQTKTFNLIDASIDRIQQMKRQLCLCVLLPHQAHKKLHSENMNEKKKHTKWTKRRKKSALHKSQWQTCCLIIHIKRKLYIYILYMYVWWCNILLKKNDEEIEDDRPDNNKKKKRG